jgi:apolipoprotein N-acyltransferase
MGVENRLFTEKGSLLISFLLGVLAAASFEEPNYFFLFLFSLLGFGFVLDLGFYKLNFLKGYLFGFGFFLTATWWLGLLKGFFFLPFLLSSYEALFFALPALITRLDFARKHSFRFYRFFLLLFVFEWLRAQGSFGFPWMSSGFYLQGTWFKNLLFLLGIYGAGFFIFICVASFLSFVVERNSKQIVLLAFLLAFVLVVSGINFSISEVKKIKVTLLQGSLLPSEKHEPDPKLRIRLIQGDFLKLVALIPKKTELVVFPETSFPDVYPFTNLWDSYLKNLASAKKTLLLIGAETFEKGHYYNSIVAYNQKGAFERYDKRYLVPFGEYVPFRENLRFLPLVRNSTDFSFGQRDAIVKIDSIRFGLGICWESAIPGYGREAALKGANLLIFSTNDNWFLFSNQSWAHWRHSKAQADASGLAVVQAANAGITGFYVNGKERYLLPWALSSLEVKVPLFRPQKEWLFLQKLLEQTLIVITLVFLFFIQVRRI